jgi:transcriptional repressor NrdR
MRCPYCQHTDTKVTDSRTTDEGNSIRRRRECINCGRRFTTYEIIEEVPLMVLKKNGRRELFDRGKLLNGVQNEAVFLGQWFRTVGERRNSVAKKVAN